MEVAVTIAEYKNQLKAQGYAEQTMLLYSAGLSLFQEYLEREKIGDLRTVTHKTLIDYRAHVMTGTQAMETKALRLRPVKRLFEYLIEKNLLLINPAEGIVETCRKNRKLGPTLTQEEMKRFIEQPNLSFNAGIRDRAVLETLYATALRIGELLSLEVYDVDLREEIIHVRKGKGRKQRVVPLGKRAAGWLKEYLQKVRPRYNRHAPRERRLFLNNKGEPLEYTSVHWCLHHCAKAAGITKSHSPHTFRRSCATHMLQEGADIRYIQQLLGHSLLSTTQQYTRVIPTDIKKTHEETHPNGNNTTLAGIPETPASAGLCGAHGGKRKKRAEAVRGVPAGSQGNRP